MTGRSRRPFLREKRERHSRRRLYITLVVAVLVALTAVALFNEARDIHPPLDPQTLCPIDRVPAEEHVVLLDATDQWTPIQREVIIQTMRKLQESIPRFSRIHLYTLTPNYQELPDPAVVLCNPGRPQDLEEIPLIGSMTPVVMANPEMMNAKWESGFVARIDSALAAYVDAGQAPESPIMETLGGASIQAFGLPDPGGPHRYVHLFSDLLQHSLNHSHYTPRPLTTNDTRHLIGVAQLGSRSLEGAEVRLYLIDRPTVRQRLGINLDELVSFWDTYFSDQGAVVTTVQRI
jgi:hypothetical protein